MNVEEQVRNLEETWKKVDKALVKRPPDCFTAKEYGLSRGISEQHARWKLNNLAAEGKIERLGTTRIWYRMK